jgi:thiosulfate dehydrogenase
MQNIVFSTCFLFFFLWACAEKPTNNTAQNIDNQIDTTNNWVAPIWHDSLSEELQYGRQLVAHTSYFFGKNGRLAAAQTNGLNCQNCHLEAGTRFLGNNYSAVAATYPKFRARSGGIENIEQRVSDCFRRSLNGEPPTADSREMAAIKAYILWIGKDVPKAQSPKGAGIARLDFLPRAADPKIGREVYLKYCASCHQANGEGLLDAAQKYYVYPPLWGDDSYNTAAGMHRIGHLAGFVKYNMPHGQASFSRPVLTDAEAWDVAAFVNSQPRPHRHFSQDFPNPKLKPVDYPFPPFSDSFSTHQHKYGPFAPIKAAATQK